MIELHSISVRGLRSLLDVRSIPIRRPTILTGANDGGKSTTLLALSFLLGEWKPSLEDFASTGRTQDGNEPLRAEEIEVVGEFSVDNRDQAALGLRSQIKLRRTVGPDLSSSYELHTSRPREAQLRDLAARKLPDVKQLAAKLGIEPTGKKSSRESWLEPLSEYVAGRPHEDGWVTAPAELVRRLPVFVMFSSTEEPDPEAQIRTALGTAYRELLENDEIIAPVRAAEAKVSAGLATQAAELCDHIKQRCPELDAIKVSPTVTFRDGLSSVTVTASQHGGNDVPLDRSGAGRRRRVNLAVWEWTGRLVRPRAAEDRAVVIAYDEPDTHLDYNRQRELIKLIQEQSAANGVRMVVATHSLNLIDRVDIEDVVHLRIRHEHTEIDRLVSGEHGAIDAYLAGLSEAMGIRNSVLLHERAFVGVEGPTEMEALPVLFRLVTGMSLQSAGIALIRGNGNDGALQFIEFLKNNDRRLAFIVVDRDSLDGKVFRPDQLRKRGITDQDIAYVGQRELEDVFSDEQWASTAIRHWPRNDGRDWESSDFEALRSSEKFSDAVGNAVRGASKEAPLGKASYLLSLVQDLPDAEAVPDGLASVIRRLERFSGDDHEPISPEGTDTEATKERLRKARARRAATTDRSRPSR